MANKRKPPVNKLNNLSYKEWIVETVSVWNQKGLGRNHPDTKIEKEHPAPFSYTDIGRLIKFFTKEGGVVLDPFVGIGSTLKACAVNNRAGVGIDLNKKYVELSKKRLKDELTDELLNTNQKVLLGDSINVIDKLETNSIDFVVTSPPYWNILNKKDHKAKQERENKGLDTKYSEDKRDLGNIEEYENFLNKLQKIFKKCIRVLKNEAYMAIVVSDFRDKSEYIMFHADLAYKLKDLGYQIKGMKVLYQRHKRIFPYGYPYSYVPNIHHQNIIIVQNKKNEKK